MDRFAWYLDDRQLSVCGASVGSRRDMSVSPDVSLTLPSSGRQVTLAGHNGPVTAHDVALLPDRHEIVATGGEDGTVRLWDFHHTDQQDSAEHPGIFQAAEVRAVVLDDGTELGQACGREADPDAWNDTLVVSLRQEWKLVLGSRTETTTRTLVDGDDQPVLVTFYADHTCDVSRTMSWSWQFLLQRCKADPVYWPQASAAVRLPTGERIAVTGGHRSDAVVWNLDEGRAIAALRAHSGWVGTVETGCLPDGTPIAVTGGDDFRVAIWDLYHHRLLARFTVLPRWRRALSVLPHPDRAAGIEKVACTIADGALWLVVRLVDEPRLHVYRYEGRRCGKQEPIPMSGAAFAARAGRVVLANHRDQLEIWKLGERGRSLSIDVEARIMGLAMTETGVIFAATQKGLAAFRLNRGFDG